MIQRGTVISQSGDRAEVTVIRISACDGCHKKNPGMLETGCGTCHECTMFPTDTELTVSAVNSAGAGIGDKVLLETETNMVLRYTAAVFLLPLLLGVCLGIAGHLLFSSVYGSFGGVCFGLLLSFLFIRCFLEPRAKRQTEYYIKDIIR